MEDNYTGLELAESESVCPACHLVYTTEAGRDGVCRDCANEGIIAL